LISAAPHLLGVKPYDPKYWPARIYLNANENPYGMPDAVAANLAQELDSLSLHRYPDPLAPSLREAIAAELDLSPENVLAGNGGDELLLDLWMAYGGPGRGVVCCPPTFSVYAYDALLTHTALTQIPRQLSVNAPDRQISCSLPEADLLAAAQDEQNSIIVIASPDNPTGSCVNLEFIELLLQSTKALVLLDQAYIEFADASYDASKLLKSYANLAILRTFSKAYALAGLRVGYLLAAPEIINELKKVRQPYSLNSLSARAAVVALRHKALYQQQIAQIVAQRERLQSALRALGIATAASQANFVLINIFNAQQLWQQLYEQYAILVRDLSGTPGLENCLRITVGTPEENDQLLAALGSLLAEDNSYA
jgi:histidinol-phosphate aminotransferase